MSSEDRETNFLYFPFINIILMCPLIHTVEELPGLFKPSCHSYHRALVTLYVQGLMCKRIQDMVLMLVERWTGFGCAYPTTVLALGLA